MEKLDTTPWYKQFWPWFLIALPGSVVIASIVTIIIATQKPHTIVADNYYKEGLAINRNLELDQRARDLGITAILQMNAEKNQVRIILGGSDIQDITKLQLSLLHPTLAHEDKQITLNLVSGNVFSANLDSFSQGARNVILKSPEKGWQMRSRIDINTTGSYPLR